MDCELGKKKNPNMDQPYENMNRFWSSNIYVFLGQSYDHMIDWN